MLWLWLDTPELILEFGENWPIECCSHTSKPCRELQRQICALQLSSAPTKQLNAEVPDKHGLRLERPHLFGPSATFLTFPGRRYKLRIILNWQVASSTKMKNNDYFLRVIPALIHYSDIVSDIPSGSHSFWDILWQPLTFLASDIPSGIQIYIYIFWQFLTYSDILSGISSDIFWHSIWYIFGDSLWLRSGGEHSDPGLAVEVPRGSLRSSACSWSPAGNTLILCLLFGSGGEHCDLAWSSACSWGPAGNTLLQRLLFGAGGEHCDLALAVEVRQGTLWSWACCSGPAGNTAI